MSIRTPIIQINGLILALLIASFLPVPMLGIVLAEVRLLLVMVLGVALTYTGVLLRRQELLAVAVAPADEPIEIARGA